MKVKVLLLFSVILLSANKVQAKGIPILYSYGTEVEKVMSLPYRTEFTSNGHHLDLGIMHEQFSIFWIPLWNYGTEKYVLYYESDDTYNYLDLSSSDLRYLQSEFGGISTFPQLPFWDVWGGKLLAIVIIGIIILIKMD